LNGTVALLEIVQLTHDVNRRAPGDAGDRGKAFQIGTMAGAAARTKKPGRRFNFLKRRPDVACLISTLEREA
jgi:hypothetical protein